MDDKKFLNILNQLISLYEKAVNVKSKDELYSTKTGICRTIIVGLGESIHVKDKVVYKVLIPMFEMMYKDNPNRYWWRPGRRVVRLEFLKQVREFYKPLFK